MVHELYAILSFVCSLIIGVIAFRSLATGYNNIHRRSFIILFFVTIFFFVIDTLWGIYAARMFSIENRAVLTFFTYACHITVTFTVFYWFRFNLRFVDNKFSNNLMLKLFSDFMLIAGIIFILSNIFTHKVFTITSDCIYNPSIYRDFLFFIQYSLFIVMFVVSLVSKIIEKNPQKKERIAISFSYSIIPLFCGIFQMIFPDLPVYSLGFMFSCLILYTFVLTSENERLIATEQKANALEEYQVILQRNYSIISSLAGNYDYVCLVDSKENTIQNLNVSGIFEDFISKSEETISPGRFDAILNTIIPDDKIDEFKKNVDRDNVTKKVLKGERVSVEFQTSYKGKEDHFRVSIASDKDDSNNFLIGFKNMESEFVMRQEIEKQKNYISNLEAQNELVVLMASMDGLTGLLNKIAFIEKVERYITEKTSKNCALLFFDMDHFKSINDVFGHEKGDEALKEMSKKLKSLFRSDELISRMGGDEFCIFLPDVSLQIVEERINLMNEKLKAVYSEKNATITTSASIGCVYCKDKNLSYVEMHKIADAAMYEVKERGRDGSEIKVV